MRKTPLTGDLGSGLLSWEQYLRNSAVPRDMIDNFLHRPGWAKFDAELGYILHDSVVPWGLEGTRTLETFQRSGARSGFLHAGRNPRINSYGNSFTECNQVSDGETWQEYLAGHFCEPIGNYGVGGHGVYQAYRRMLREEKTEHGAEYVILYVWGDDPLRSLLRSFWVARYRWYDTVSLKQILFHGNPWAHIEMDLLTGRWVERENPLPTHEALYKMCDPEWIVEYHHDDVAMQLNAYAGVPSFGLPGKTLDLDRKRVDQLADALEFRFDWSSHVDCRSQALKLQSVYSQRGANHVLDKARAFAQTSDKKLLVVLNYTARYDSFRTPIIPYDGTRQDQEILDHLIREGFDYFDMNAVHQREYEKTTGSYSQYMRQYLVGDIGHYNPRGNHLFAYSIKNTLVEMVEPKPLPYQDRKTETMDFTGYLPNA
jgi:hypothetical protein